MKWFCYFTQKAIILIFIFLQNSFMINFTYVFQRILKIIQFIHIQFHAYFYQTCFMKMDITLWLPVYLITHIQALTYCLYVHIPTIYLQTYVSKTLDNDRTVRIQIWTSFPFWISSLSGSLIKYILMVPGLVMCAVHVYFYMFGRVWWTAIKNNNLFWLSADPIIQHLLGNY